MLAVVRRITSKLIIPKSIEKIHEIDSHIGEYYRFSITESVRNKINMFDEAIYIYMGGMVFEHSVS